MANMFYESVFVVDEETHQEYLHKVNKKNAPKTPKDRLKKLDKDHHITDKYGEVLFNDKLDPSTASTRLDRIAQMNELRKKKAKERGDSYYSY